MNIYIPDEEGAKLKALANQHGVTAGGLAAFLVNRCGQKAAEELGEIYRTAKKAVQEGGAR